MREGNTGKRSATPICSRLRARAGLRRELRLLVAAVTLSTISLAQHGPESSYEPDRHFFQGKTLLQIGAIAEACESFRRSFAARPRNGTLLNLAVCLHRQGDHVASFRHFESALLAAEADGRADRVKLAHEHLATLKGQLAWLTINTAGVVEL